MPNVYKCAKVLGDIHEFGGFGLFDWIWFFLHVIFYWSLSGPSLLLNFKLEFSFGQNDVLFFIRFERECIAIACVGGGGGG